MAASPSFKINSGAVGAKASVAAASTVNFALNSLDGITAVEWTVINTDETSSPASYTLTPSGLYGSSMSLTALGVGTAAIVRCKVNGGIDPQTEQPSAAMQTTAKFFVPTIDGLEVECGGEVNESNASVGLAEVHNEAIRQIASGGSSADTKASVRIATTANDSLSGLAARDGVTPVAGDRVLVKDHATPSSRGVYTAASGAWSRAADFNDNAEVTCGARVYVEEGTVNGGTQWILTTANPITVGSTSLTFTKDTSHADKTTLDSATSSNLNDTLVKRGASGESSHGALTVTSLAASSGAGTVTAATSVSAPFYQSSASNPAASGLLRGANNTVLVAARNAGNTADVDCLKLDGSNDIIIGEATDGRNVTASVPTGGFFSVSINSAERVRLTSTHETWTGATTISGNSSITIQPSSILVLDGIGGWYLETNGVIQIQGNATGLGFFAVTPVAKQADIGALTDNTGGTADNTLQALPDPADSPASADALRDDLVANLIPALRNDLADLAEQCNALRTVLRNYGLMA